MCRQRKDYPNLIYTLAPQKFCTRHFTADADDKPTKYASSFDKIPASPPYYVRPTPAPSVTMSNKRRTRRPKLMVVPIFGTPGRFVSTHMSSNAQESREDPLSLYCSSGPAFTVETLKKKEFFIKSQENNGYKIILL